MSERHARDGYGEHRIVLGDDHGQLRARDLSRRRECDDRHRGQGLAFGEYRPAHQYGNRLIQMNEGKIIRDIGTEEKSKLQLQDLFGWFA